MKYKFKYETLTFPVQLKERHDFEKKLQIILNERGDKGWKLHSMNISGVTSPICICVFEKSIKVKKEQFFEGDLFNEKDNFLDND